MRIHCLENVDKALQFLREQRVHLENMGSHDIVDGNPRLNLGLIWTIILRFQVNQQKPRVPWTRHKHNQKNVAGHKIVWKPIVPFIRYFAAALNGCSECVVNTDGTQPLARNLNKIQLK